MLVPHSIPHHFPINYTEEQQLGRKKLIIVRERPRGIKINALLIIIVAVPCARYFMLPALSMLATTVVCASVSQPASRRSVHGN